MSEADEWIKKDTIVLDLGSGYILAGFAGEDAPENPHGIIPAAVATFATPKYPSTAWAGMDPSWRSRVFVGDEVNARRGVFDVTRIPWRGRVEGDVHGQSCGREGEVHGQSRDSVEDRFWRKGLQRIVQSVLVEILKVSKDDPADRARYRYAPQDDPKEAVPIKLIVGITPSMRAAKVARSCFAAHKSVSHVLVAQRSVFATLASCPQECILVHVGHTTTWVVPFAAPTGILWPGVQFQPLGGIDVTNYMMQLRLARGETDMDPSSASDVRLLNWMKQKFCRVCKDRETALSKPNEGGPSDVGRGITLESERFVGMELLFDPGSATYADVKDKKTQNQFVLRDSGGAGGVSSKELLPLCELVMRSIKAVGTLGPINTIVLSGGTTVAEGFVDRFTSTMEARFERAFPGREPPAIAAPAERKFCSWIGGSIVGSVKHFEQYCMTSREDFEASPWLVEERSGYNFVSGWGFKYRQAVNEAFKGALAVIQRDAPWTLSCRLLPQELTCSRGLLVCCV